MKPPSQTNHVLLSLIKGFLCKAAKKKRVSFPYFLYRYDMQSYKLADPIFVVGAAHTGKLFVTGTLSACGAWCAPSTSGKFENPEFFGTVFGAIGRASKTGAIANFVDDPAFLDDRETLKFYYRMPSQKPWFLKYPGIVAHSGEITWQLWDQYFPNAKWVIVQRDYQGMLAGHLDQYGYLREDTELILEQLGPLKSYLTETGKGYCEIRPLESFDAPLTNYKAMVEFSGLSWEEGRVRQFMRDNPLRSKAPQSLELVI